MKKTILCAVVASTAICASSASAQSYSFQDLNHGATYSTARGINNAGQIVGDVVWANTSETHAALWNRASLIDLGTSGGNYSTASAINNRGQITGASTQTGYETIISLWQADTGHASLAATTLSGGSGLNNHGQLAGWSSDPTTGGPRATVWNGDKATYLDTLGGFSSFASAINDNGQAVGGSYLAGSNATHATSWSGSAVTDLGTLGGPNSWAQAINASGVIVGYSNLSDGANAHATAWKNGSIIDLGSLGGDGALANAVNSRGQIVGFSYTGDFTSFPMHATLWDGTKIIDLNNFIDRNAANAGWVLSNANGINDDGSIVGEAYNTVTGQTHAFLLSAVPEPASYLLLLAGLGLLGWTTRRHAGRAAATSSPPSSPQLN